jgi:two-component system, chemotaxis family, protein-glutamate methylesterase/glutaminase
MDTIEPGCTECVVLVGASAGGVETLARLLEQIPQDFAAPILIVLHIGDRESALPAVLARYCALPVSHAVDGQQILPGTVLVAPPGRHLLVERRRSALFAVLTRGPKENYCRPAIDTLFRSAAVAANRHAIGVVLTGYLDDGAAGLQAIKACGGIAIAQDPADAIVPDMPRHAMDQVDVDLCLPLDAMGAALEEKIAELGRAGAAAAQATPEAIAVENRFAFNKGDINLLKRIANPSQYSCPECGGALFAVSATRPGRFRCHTGHSYTMLSLLSQVETAVDQGLAATLRALQEKENLAEQLAVEFAARLPPEPGYAAMASRARADAAVLRELLSRQQPLDTVPVGESADPEGEP